MDSKTALAILALLEHPGWRYIEAAIRERVSSMDARFIGYSGSDPHVSLCFQKTYQATRLMEQMIDGIFFEAKEAIKESAGDVLEGEMEYVR